MTSALCSLPAMTDWRAEASRVIQAFDCALGRPPFPASAADDLVRKAQAVQETLGAAVSAGKLALFEGLEEVTTTLPVLCASLREGSPNRKPCLRLYRFLLLAVAEVSCFSTYPLSFLLRDAEELLTRPVVLTLDRPSVNCAMTRDSATEEENEATLFKFMARTRTLTPMHMRRFLSMPPSEPIVTKKKKEEEGDKRTNDSKKKHKKSSRLDKENSKDITSSHPPHRGCEVASSSSTVPRALLRAMMEMPLSEECHAVFELFVDNTSHFLNCVGEDGDLAECILDVYAARIVPKLKPSSLLPCLDASLLDYFVDIVAASQAAGHATLLTSPELQRVPLQTWDLARLDRLARAAFSRRIGPQDAMASVLVYVLIYRIYSDFALHDFSRTSPISSARMSEAKSRISGTESVLIAAIFKASKAVLVIDGMPSSCGLDVSVFTYSKTGVLFLEDGALSPVLELLHVFGTLLLARPAALELWRGGLDLQLEEEEERRAAALMMSSSVPVVEAFVVSLLKAVVESPPQNKNNSGASPAPKPHSKTSAAGKTKGRQKKVIGENKRGSCPEVAQGSALGHSPSDVAGHSPAPKTLSEVLSICCMCFVLTTLVRRGANVADIGGYDAVHAGCLQDVLMIDYTLRAYAYLLQYQSQRLNTALWDNFNTFFTCFMWQFAMLVSCAAMPIEDSSQLSSMRNLLRSPRTVTVLTALTADTGKILWLSPLLLPACISRQNSANAAVEMLSQVLWGFSCCPLWMAVVRAAVHADHSHSEGTPPEQLARSSSALLKDRLHPVSDGFLLGVVCSQWSDAVLADVAEDMVGSTSRCSEGAFLVSCLTRMCSAGAYPLAVVAPPASGVTLECVPGSLSLHGLQCLLEKVKQVQERRILSANAAHQKEEELHRKEIIEQMEDTRARNEADRLFHEAEKIKRAARADAELRVREELQRRRAAHDARLSEEAAALVRKRQVATETLRRKAEQTRLEAEETRKLRFISYRRRLESEYRVSTFLEHLHLSSARVMEVREALQVVIDRISPDDLLEYLVSGVAQVPADMLDDHDHEGHLDVASGIPPTGTASSEDLMTASGPQPEHKALASNVQVGGPTEERLDFWADVMQGVMINRSDVHVDGVGSSSRPLVEAAVTPAPSVSKVDTKGVSAGNTRSFHARIAPLMDLFCYDDGDECGHVPEVFPTLRLRVTSRVWPAVKIQALGFTDVREAFERMMERGLVRIFDGVVQLTLLGYRYHYPFHNPEGMLQVLLQEARDRIRALVGARTDLRGQILACDERSEELDDSTDGSRDTTSSSEDRLLPDVEFGI